MPFLSTGADATVVIPAGQSIRVGALADALATITIPTGQPGGPIGIVEDSQSVFGPYRNGATVSVTATRGEIEYVVGVTPILSASVYGNTGADVLINVTSGNAAAIIQPVLDNIKASGRRSTPIKILSSGAFTLTSTITINPWYHNVDFAGAVVTYTPITGAAINIECDQVNVFTQLLGGVQNINLVGSRVTAANGNTSIGLYCYGTANSTRTSCAMHDITIDGFNEGVKFDDYAYLTHFYGIVINGFRTNGVNQNTGAHDAGENISLHGGCISNGGTAVTGTDDSTEIGLYGMSIDYNLQVFKLSGGGRIHMSGGHIECNGGTAADDQIYIAGQSTVTLEGVYVVLNTAAGAGPYAYANYVNVVDSNSTLVATACKFTNARNTADLWATGSGRVYLDRPVFFDNSLMPYRMHTANNSLNDGGFENAAVRDMWYVTSQGGAYTTKLAKNDGCSIATSTDTARTGTRSLKILRGAVGAGYTVGARLMIPVTGRAGKAMFCNFWANSTLGANTVMSLYQSSVSVFDSLGVPTYNFRQAYAAPFQSTNIPNNWTTQVAVQNGSFFRVAPWATHVEIEFDISAGGSSTALYLDDFTVEFY